MLNSFDPQTTVLDWDLEDDGSPMDQVPLLLLPLSFLKDMNIKRVPLFISSYGTFDRYFAQDVRIGQVDGVLDFDSGEEESEPTEVLFDPLYHPPLMSHNSLFLLGQ